jgi:hypothetical protein
VKRLRAFLSVGLTLVALAAAPAAEAVDVLFFNSTRFVDFGQGPAYPEGSQEAQNVQIAVAALGHTVTTIAGPDDPVGSCPPHSQPGTVLATADGLPICSRPKPNVPWQPENSSRRVYRNAIVRWAGRLPNPGEGLRHHHQWLGAAPRKYLILLAAHLAPSLP